MKRSISLIAFCAPLAAYAGFAVVKAPSQAPVSVAAPAASASYTALNLLGQPPGMIETRSGFGRGVSLADALQQIAPAGWHAQTKPSMADRFDRTKKVSWQGGQSWTRVLDALAVSEGISVDIDWEKQVLFVGDRSERPSALSISTDATKPSGPPPPKSWEARAGATLRETTMAWAKSAGYDVVWVPKDLDYTFPGRIAEKGDFISATTRLFDNYLEANRPMTPKFYPEQRLLVIKEKK